MFTGQGQGQLLVHLAVDRMAQRNAEDLCLIPNIQIFERVFLDGKVEPPILKGDCRVISIHRNRITEIENGVDSGRSSVLETQLVTEAEEILMREGDKPLLGPDGG